MVALYCLLGFVLLMIVEYYSIKGEKKFHPAFQKNYEVIENVVFDNLSVTIPVDSYISKGHTWASLQGNGLVKVGVDEFVLKSIGKFIVTHIAKPGSIVKKGDVIIEAELGNKTFGFRSPVDGTINYINDDLVGKIISDPYGEDWGVFVSPINFERNVKSLKANEGVVEWMKNEFNRLKNYLIEMSAQPKLAGATMLDGGKLMEGAVSQLSNDSMKTFENEFLSI